MNSPRRIKPSLIKRSPDKGDYSERPVILIVLHKDTLYAIHIRQRILLIIQSDQQEHPPPPKKKNRKY